MYEVYGQKRTAAGYSETLQDLQQGIDPGFDPAELQMNLSELASQYGKDPFDAYLDLFGDESATMPALQVMAAQAPGELPEQVGKQPAKRDYLDDGRGLRKTPDPTWDPQAHDPRIDYDRLVQNAISRYNGATDQEREDGRNWYNGARIWLQNFVDKNGGDYSRAAAAMAALSPQLSWEKNLEGGAHFLRTYNPAERDKWLVQGPDGEPQLDRFGRPTGTGLPMLGTNVIRAMDVYDADDPRSVMGRDDWGADGPKIHSFWKNFLGDEDYVTIDKHMLRALDRGFGEDPLMSYGVNGSKDTVKREMTPEDLRVKELENQLGYSQGRNTDGSKINTGYNTYADAVRDATRQINQGLDPSEHITPAQMQAIIWTQHKGDMDRFDQKNRRAEWENRNPGGDYDLYQERYQQQRSKTLPAKPKQPIPSYEQSDQWAEANPFAPARGDADRTPIPRPKRNLEEEGAAPPWPADNIPDVKSTFNDMAGEQAMGTPGAPGSGLKLDPNSLPEAGPGRRRVPIKPAEVRAALERAQRLLAATGDAQWARIHSSYEELER